ncbi:tumor necrosis factor receptor superfamily member 14-like [Hemibagrus wyckioides]|uniref:tumor necrosis factor receptor superfamily member 14-like n=1 Tax=Hemibagrus wyckioides TaxID=337641 RepID=UPI00266B8F54|nr:tumor necrosis factor receptor superfamily member 14-like [Hemibagrus wyckioides]
MVSIWNHAFIMNSFLFLNIELCICTCAQAEYEINGEWCPMCPSGSHVFRHCTEVTSTCIQCVCSSYMDDPRGLPSCISCTVCNTSKSFLCSKSIFM